MLVIIFVSSSPTQVFDFMHEFSEWRRNVQPVEVDTYTFTGEEYLWGDDYTYRAAAYYYVNQGRWFASWLVIYVLASEGECCDAPVALALHFSPECRRVFHLTLPVSTVGVRLVSLDSFEVIVEGKSTIMSFRETPYANWAELVLYIAPTEAEEVAKAYERFLEKQENEGTP